MTHAQIKMKAAYYKLIMSSKKVIRLKTPIKSKQQGKISETTTQLSGVQFNQQSTIMLVKNVACSQELQVTLINQINKIYKQMSKLRQVADDSILKREQTSRENKTLKGKLEILEREYKMYKEMYELQKENHEWLRKFYQQREKEWLNIVAQHKKILHEYENKSINGLSDIRLLPQYLQLESMYTNMEEMLNKPNLASSKDARFTDRRQRRKLKNSLQREDSLSQPKPKLKLNSQKETNKYKDTSQIRQQQEKSPIKMKASLDISRKTITARHYQSNDELFDSIIKKTFYRYKEKQIAVYEIQQLEDMVKLKNAKTSTRDRLAKTIRKLDFQISNQQQFKLFCETVERIVVERRRILRGDYAFDLLIEKLKECERTALSNSQIYKEHINPQREKGLQNDSQIGVNDDIYRGGQKTLQLLVDSTIKDDKTLEKIRKMSSEQDIDKVKPSSTTLRRND